MKRAKQNIASFLGDGREVSVQAGARPWGARCSLPPSMGLQEALLLLREPAVSCWEHQCWNYLKDTINVRVGKTMFKKSEFRQSQTSKCFYMPSLKRFHFFLRLINCFRGTCCQYVIFIEQFSRERGQVSVYSSCLMLRIIFRIFWMACANYLVQ